MCNMCEWDATGETALTLAAGSGKVETVALLLKHNAEVSKSRPGGAQPIHTAAASGQLLETCWPSMPVESRVTY